MESKKRDFNELRDIVAKLRSKDGCPWDREQDSKTIKNYLLEETYEIIQAIDEDDHENLMEELGDVMFQILFLARIAEESGHFDIDDSITCAYEKFIRRHPHVFEKDACDNKELSSKEVLKLWDSIKKDEKPKDNRDILDGIPKTMPALLRAHEVSKRCERVGFDWKQKEDVLKKLNEEVLELEEAVSNDDLTHIEEELGDMLFVLVNLCRFLKVNPENALIRTTNKFINRFRHVQERAGYEVAGKDLEMLESYWEEAKKLTR